MILILPLKSTQLIIFFNNRAQILNDYLQTEGYHLLKHHY